MYIVIGGDQSQIKYAKAEAKANGERFYLFDKIPDLTSSDPQDKKRITIRAHGSLSTYGASRENGMNGYSAEQFVDALIKKNLLEGVEVLDLVGCNIGLVNPRTGTSYVQDVSNLLEEKGFDLKINAVTEPNESGEYAGLLVNRPQEYGQPIPPPSLYTEANYSRIIGILGNMYKALEKFNTINSALKDIKQKDALDGVIKWKKKNVAWSDELKDKEKELKEKNKKRKDYKNPVKLNDQIETLENQISSLTEQLKEPDFATAGVNKNDDIRMLRELRGKLEVKIRSYATILKKFDFLERDYMYSREDDLKPHLGRARREYELLDCEQNKIPSTPLQLNSTYHDQRHLLDSTPDFCVRKRSDPTLSTNQASFLDDGEKTDKSSSKKTKREDRNNSEDNSTKKEKSKEDTKDEDTIEDKRPIKKAKILATEVKKEENKERQTGGLSDLSFNNEIGNNNARLQSHDPMSVSLNQSNYYDVIPTQVASKAENAPSVSSPHDELMKRIEHETLNEKERQKTHSQATYRDYASIRKNDSNSSLHGEVVRNVTEKALQKGIENAEEKAKDTEDKQNNYKSPTPFNTSIPKLRPKNT